MRTERLRDLLVAELKRYLLENNRPRLPAGGELLWDWFLDIHRSRSVHAGGLNPITYGEIEAYARLYRWEMRPYHIEVLFALDRAFLDTVQEQIRIARDGKTADGTKVLPPRSKHAVSPEIFDAMF